MKCWLNLERQSREASIGEWRRVEKHHGQKVHRPQVREETGVCIRTTSISSLNPSAERIERNLCSIDSRVNVNGIQHLHCVVSTQVLAHESLKPVNMLRYLKSMHPSLVAKPAKGARVARPKESPN